jgi:hypothetical protein
LSALAAPAASTALQVPSRAARSGGHAIRARADGECPLHAAGVTGAPGSVGAPGIAGAPGAAGAAGAAGAPGTFVSDPWPAVLPLVRRPCAPGQGGGAAVRLAEPAWCIASSFGWCVCSTGRDRSARVAWGRRDAHALARLLVGAARVPTPGNVSAGGWMGASLLGLLGCGAVSDSSSAQCSRSGCADYRCQVRLTVYLLHRLLPAVR